MEDPAPAPLIAPYGGRLVDLLVPPDEQDALHATAQGLPSVRLTERAACDLELLAVGGFSPLAGFMGQADYRRVLAEMRLADGTLFPIPVTLPVEPSPALRLDHDVALRDAQDTLLAVLTVEELYAWDRDALAQAVLGTRDPRHPLVAELPGWGPLHAAGRLRVLRLPRHDDFTALRLTPAQTRARLAAQGRPNVVAFQTRNPLHRAHEELTRRAMQAVDGTLLLHPAVGLTRPGDVDHYTRVRTYQALTAHYYPADRVVLALLPLAMRMAGPREALWHALIRRNYGANYFIVGRDHAGPGQDSAGRPFYPPAAAQALVTQHSAELGVGVLPFAELVYLPDEDRYEEAGRIPPGTPTATLTGTAVRADYLDAGRPLPAWFTRPEVAAILAEAYPPRHQQGVCVWLTGLPGAGKSTIAEGLATLLRERGRRVTVLDSDALRQHLSRGLGFSPEDRDTHIRRVGFVAAEIVRHGGVAICAAISPYAAVRAEVRAGMDAGHFIEVYVATPLAVCEARDPKGMYAEARRGARPHFTGIDAPYEPPTAPELALDTTGQTPEASGQAVLAYLQEHGFVRPAEG
jgi:sulfate adenylyltransferase